MRYLFYFLFGLMPIFGISQTICKPEIIHFRRQSQVDSFPIIFKGCDYIDSAIFIWRSGIFNLDSLYFVKRFNRLVIQDTNIENIDGLNGVDSIGSLQIFGNKSLKNLHGLQNLKKAYYISIGAHDSMPTLHGLNLDSLIGQISLSTLGASSDNAKLKNLTGLKANFIGKLILGNEYLEDLSGSEIKYLKWLTISRKNTLKRLADLNPREKLEISISNTIIDLSELNELLKIPDHELKQLRLTNLPNLQNCAIEYICKNIHKEDFLFLENLGTGCTSIDEIKASCLVMSLNVLIDEWSVYPNPVTDYLKISFSDNQSGQIKIFDVTGRLVSSFENQTGSKQLYIESHSWQPGLYFVQFVMNKGAFATKKVVKN